MRRLTTALFALLFATVALADSINIPAPLYLQTTWTPTLVGSVTPGTGQTYATQIGTCEVVGRQVTIRWFVSATSLGTAAGNLQLSGFSSACGTPTTTANDFGACTVPYYNVTGLAALNYGIGGLINPSTTIVNLTEFNNTAAGNLTVAQAGSTVNFVGWCSYHTGP